MLSAGRKGLHQYNARCPGCFCGYMMHGKNQQVRDGQLTGNPFAHRTAKTLWSFGHSECNRVKNTAKVEQCLPVLVVCRLNKLAST